MKIIKVLIFGILISSIIMLYNLCFDYYGEKANKAPVLYVLVNQMYLNNDVLLLSNISCSDNFPAPACLGYFREFSDGDLSYHSDVSGVKFNNEFVFGNNGIYNAYLKSLSGSFLTHIDDSLISSYDSGMKWKFSINLHWLHDINNYAEYKKVVDYIFNIYKELAKRLSILHNARAEALENFGKNSDVSKFDEDIKLFSGLGMKLAEPTKQFFELAKQQMLQQKITTSRIKAKEGLKSFAEQIDQAAKSPNQALGEKIDTLLKAGAELNKAMEQ